MQRIFYVTFAFRLHFFCVSFYLLYITVTIPFDHFTALTLFLLL